MVFAFKCGNCSNIKLFQDFHSYKNRKVCTKCLHVLKKQEELEEKKKAEEDKNRREAELRRKKERERKERTADEKLRKQLKEEEKQRLEKKKEALEKKKSKKGREEKPEVKQHTSIKRVSLEKQAEYLSKTLGKVLYVYADVKRLRVLEWVNGKKRIALNKEREIRKTRKGGFSQEKFQRFVDFRKKQTAMWIEEHLLGHGVLRRPYDKVIVECDDKELEKFVKDLLGNK